MIKANECPVCRTAGESEVLEQSCKHCGTKNKRCEIKEKYKRRVSFYQNESNHSTARSSANTKNSFGDSAEDEPKIEKVGKEKRIYAEGTNYYVKENRFYRHPRHTTWQDDEDLAIDDEE
jgi:hypothetical protein